MEGTIDPAAARRRGCGTKHALSRFLGHVLDCTEMAMFKRYPIITMLVFAAVSPADAALDTHGGSVADVAAVTAADRQQITDAVCMPPDPQYLSTFIRNIDGAIVGIRYDIVDYVC
jgi:hypothetical protein